MVEQGTPHEARSTQADDLNAAAAEVSNVETVAAEAAETLTDASQNLDDISADEVVVEGSPEVESASVAEDLYIEAKKQVEEWQGTCVFMRNGTPTAGALTSSAKLKKLAQPKSS